MTAPDLDAPVVSPSSRRLRRFVRNPLGMTAAAVLLLIVLSALLAPWISPFSPNEIVLKDALLPPSAEHLLGTDASGRDQLSRLLWGGRSTLYAGLVMIVTAIACGVPTGLLAGYHAGRFDTASSWFSDLLMSLPQILILIVVITALGNGIYPTMIALGILSSPDMYRLTRSVVVTVRNELYIDAARVSGLSPGRIIFRHVLAVIVGPVLVRSALVFGLAIIVQSGLEFLGFGQSDRPSWGRMLSEAFQTVFRAPSLVYPPGVAIGVTVVCLILVASAAADTLGINRSGGARRKPAVTPVAPTLGSRAGGITAAGPASASRSGADEQGEADSTGSTSPLLRVAGLRVSYTAEDGSETAVVDDVALELHRGEVLGLVGESGSGKSQTSFAVLGLLPTEASVTAARLELDGLSLLGMTERQRQQLRGIRMAYVPQEPMSNLDPSFTVGYQLVKPMVRKLKISRREARVRALALLERVGIPDPPRTMASYPHELSGGMAQRVLIAGAVSCDPELLVADEPTTALDVTVQAEVLNLLRSLQRERDMGMILVTHNLGVVADICDRVAVMHDGRIVETAPVGALFTDPQHPYTRSLLEATLEGAPARLERDAAGVTR